MAVIPEITCRRCGSKYSGLRTRCPKCGAPRMNQPTRVPPTTASATPKTAASGRAAINIRWQFVFAAVLLLALILAVVVLVVSNGKNKNAAPSNNTNPGQSSVPTYVSADLPTPSPSPEPTPDATATPEIQSMAIVFINTAFKDHSMTLNRPGEIFDIDLDVNTYPTNDSLPVTWRSTNEKILTVTDRGFITVVGASPNRTVHAGIIAECGGLEDYVTVYIPAFQAAYLKENLYDPETYDADNLDWDTFIYATPVPKQ